MLVTDMMSQFLVLNFVAPVFVELSANHGE